MLSWALAFFIIAIIAAVFGFWTSLAVSVGVAGLASAAVGAKILFVIFVVLFIISFVAGLLQRP